MAGSSGTGSLLHNFHQGRGGKQWWLEVPDCLGPQEQMLQELAPIRPGMFGHLREPFIRITLQEHDTLQELTKAYLNKSGRVRKLFMRLMVLASKNSYPIVLRNRHRGHKYAL